jgi:ATP-dependent exoDNAse (exonuclease V) beta subunit
VIVQAPAGSGKTSLLVERFLKLLASVDRPEEILAITFTRKAASEMRHRILTALETAAAAAAPRVDPAGAAPGASPAAAALARSRQLGWHLLEAPNRLRIQTIDSLAMALGRSLPVGSGFDPTTEPTENAQALYLAAANRLLMRLYQDDPLTAEIARFLRQCDNDADRARRLIAAMLARRDQWLELLGAVVAGHREHPEGIRELLVQGLTSLARDVIDAFRRPLDPRLLAELDELTREAGSALDRNLDDPVARHRLLAEVFTTSGGELRKRFDRRQGFPKERKALKARATELTAELARLELAEPLTNLRHLPQPWTDPAAVHRLINVCVTLVLANAELEIVFRETRRTDFCTLVLNAQTALGEDLAPSELALSLDHRIQHLLIDEFQDTSVSQFRLFERLLTGWSPDDGRTLFLVGDPMQSIYRFRDADVSLFYLARDQGVGPVALEDVSLTSNFRADPTLVSWTNQTFGTIMGSRQDPVLGRIGFHSASAALPPTAEPRPVSLTLSASEAAQIQDVVESIESRLHDSPGSIAVLLRSRSHVSGLITALRERNISWRANDIEPLADKPVVADLLTLAAVLENPRDRLSWFSLLRCPLIGLTLHDLTLLDGVSRFPVEPRALDTLPLSGSGRSRLARLAEVWQPVAAKRDEYPPRSVLETLWLKLGGADAYPDPDALTHAARLLALVDDLGERASSAAELEAAVNLLFAADTTPGRLEILTMHKAKGLEFDHVLVPFLERTTRADEPELLMWRALPDGLLMGVQGDEGPYAWLSREARARERHERQRLFYVACTRARRTLELFGTATDKSPDSSLLSLLWPLIESGETGPLIVQRRDDPEGAQVAQILRDTPAEPSTPELLRLVDGYRWHPPDLPRAQAEAPWHPPAVGDPLDARFEVVLGIIVHRALAKLAERPPQEDPTAYLLAERAGWEQEARSHHLTPGDVHQIVTETDRQLRAVLSDPDGRWILFDAGDARSEFAVTGHLDGHTQRYVIDRTFEADGIRWVIDYKTTRPAQHADLEGFIGEELSRYRPQVERYARLMEAISGRKPRAAIYFTAIPRLVRL